MAQVDLQNVSKLFPGGVKAVDSVDLKVADQEFVVLVGPSGCGKSTTLRMIAGLEKVSQGLIRIGDRVVNDLPPKDRDVAMVFQNYALYPHMTVFRNLSFALKLRRVPRTEIRRRIMEVAKILELEHLLDRKPRALSGGQRQRVAVGRAIVRQPAAFLFDEPLSNLDASLRVATRAELKRLHQRLRTTSIYVTHDQEEAMTLGDRIVVMKDGRIQQADAPLRTYNCPVNRFVAGFIGMPPMNFFDGVIRRIDGQLVFEQGKLTDARAARPPSSGAAGRANPAGAAAKVAPGRLTLPGNGFTLPIPAHLQEALAGHLNAHVVLGIRPEHLYPHAACGKSALDVTVNVVEPLGSDMDVYMETTLHDSVVVRMEAQDGLPIGAQVKLYVDLRRIHVFEPGETGMNLSLTSEPAHAIA